MIRKTPDTAWIKYAANLEHAWRLKLACMVCRESA